MHPACILHVLVVTSKGGNWLPGKPKVSLGKLRVSLMTRVFFSLLVLPLQRVALIIQFAKPITSLIRGASYIYRQLHACTAFLLRTSQVNPTG